MAAPRPGPVGVGTAGKACLFFADREDCNAHLGLISCPVVTK